MNLAEIRKKYPQYDAIDDATLAQRLYQKYYADKMPFTDFADKIGFNYRSKKEKQALAEKGGPIDKPLLRKRRNAPPRWDFAAYAPYGAISALRGFMQPALDPLKSVGLDTKGVLDTAIDYYREKAAPGPNIPNFGIGIAGGSTGNLVEDLNKNIEIQKRTPVPLRNILGSTAEATGFVAGPVNVASRASGLFIEKIAQGARPAFRAIARGMATGALLGEGKKKETLSNAALFGIFEAAGVAAEKIANSAAWHEMPVRDRRLVLQSLEDTLSKNPNMTEGEILRKWNNPTWRKEALSRRMKTEGEGISPAAEPSPSEPTIIPRERRLAGQGFKLKGKAYDPAEVFFKGKMRLATSGKALPAGQGFQTYPEDYARVILRKALPRGEGDIPKQLPYQGFELKGEPFTPVPPAPVTPAQESAAVFQKLFQESQSPQGAELLRQKLAELEAKDAGKIRENEGLVRKTSGAKSKGSQDKGGENLQRDKEEKRTEAVKQAPRKKEVEKTLNSVVKGHGFKFEGYVEPGSGYAPEGYSFHATDKNSPIHGSTIAVPDLKPDTIKKAVDERVAMFTKKQAKPPEVTPEAAAPEKIKPGRAWVNNQWKPIIDAKEIKRGKNKGKLRVTLTKKLASGKNKSVIVAAGAIKEMPGGGKPSVKEVSKLPEKKPVKIVKAKQAVRVRASIPKSKAETLEPKEQKAYLLAEIDKAIADQSKKEKSEWYHFEVPGDGEYDVMGSRLGDFKKRVSKLPATKIKNKKVIKIAATGPLTKRIVGEDVEYYNPFRAKKLPKNKVAAQITAHSANRVYYQDGLYSDGGYIVKLDKKFVSGKPIAKDAPNIKELFKEFSTGKFKPAAMAEFKPADEEIHAFVHVVDKAGKKETVLNAQYVDSILTVHPDATPFIKEGNQPVIYKSGNDVVGVVMPVNSDLSSFDSKFLQEGKERVFGSTLTESAKKQILNNKGEVEIDIEAIKKAVKDLDLGLSKEDASLLELGAGLPFWMADKYPETAGKIQKVVQDRFNNKNIIRNHYHKALIDAWDGLSDTEVEHLNKIFWKGDKLGGWLNEKGLSKLTPAERRVYETWKDISEFILLEERPALMEEYGTSKTDIEEYMREAGKIKGYMPHYRDGRFSVLATEKGTGKRVYRKSFDDLVLNITKRVPKVPDFGVRAWHEKNKVEKMFDDAIVEVIQNQQIFPEDAYFDVSPQVVQELLNAAMKRYEGTPKEKEAALKAWERAAADIFHLRGFGAHFTKRRGTPGYDMMDFREAQLRYTASWAGYKAKILAARQLREVWGKIDWTNKERLRKYLDRQIRDTFENTDIVDRTVDMARALLFRQFLGFRAKSAALNMTQNFIALVPALTTETKWAEAKVIKEMTLAARDIARGRTTKGRLAQKARRLDPETMKALLRAREDGTVAAQMTEELAGRKFGKYDSALSKLDKASGWLFSETEVGMNREPAFVVAFRIARKEKGMNFEDSYKFAKNIVGQAHFEYGRHNLPPFARGRMKTMRAFYAFRHYTMNILNLWGKLLFRSGPRGKYAFLKSMGALMFFGGLASVPLIESINWAYHKLTGKDIWSEIAKTTGRWTRYVFYGAPALVGVEMTGSLSTDLPKDLWEVFGAPTTWVRKGARSKQFLERGDTYRAIEDFPFMPSVGRDVLSGYRLATRGSTRMSGKKILNDDFKQVKLTPFETGGQFLGFRPIKLTEGYRKYRSRKQVLSYWNEKRSLILDRYGTAVDKYGIKSKQVKAIHKEIQAFNKSKPIFVNSINGMTLRMRLRNKPTKKQFLLQRAVK